MRKSAAIGCIVRVGARSGFAGKEWPVTEKDIRPPGAPGRTDTVQLTLIDFLVVGFQSRRPATPSVRNARWAAASRPLDAEPSQDAVATPPSAPALPQT